MSVASPAPEKGAPDPKPALFLDAAIEIPALISLPHGCAAVVSMPNPHRDKPNQDAAVVVPIGEREAFLAVADGMGGTRQGGAAAGALMSRLSELDPSELDGLQLRTSILDGIERTNQYLLEEVPDAGTTLAAVEISEHSIRPYHIGDSDIFVVGQRGKLKLKTVSHSPVGMAFEAGLLTEHEALHHHERNLILNAVGSPEMRIELGAPLNLSRYDTVLLASDGLTDNLLLDEIIELIRSGPLDCAVRELTELARSRMLKPEAGHPSKPDDLTVVAYRRTR